MITVAVEDLADNEQAACHKDDKSIPSKTCIVY